MSIRRSEKFLDLKLFYENPRNLFFSLKQWTVKIIESNSNRDASQIGKNRIRLKTKSQNVTKIKRRPIKKSP